MTGYDLVNARILKSASLCFIQVNPILQRPNFAAIHAGKCLKSN